MPPHRRYTPGRNTHFARFTVSSSVEPIAMASSHPTSPTTIACEHVPAGTGVDAPRSDLTRRGFLESIAAGAGSLAAFGLVPRITAAAEPGRTVRVAVVGLGRGMGHVQTLLKIPGVEIAYLAEVDPGRLALGMKSVAAKQTQTPVALKDFRAALDDASLDAVFFALPNFWHTPASLVALQAGKHVYVEKPGSQNPREAEMIVAAARQYGRLVQMGNQRRTWMKDGIAALHDGAIGTVRFGRAFYYNARKAVAPRNRQLPEGLDLDLWQGPVPDDPAHDLRTLIHYDWHWFWHWGNGELGNNGVHTLDILRWGLRADHPLRVTYTGGRYWHDDAQETPDTATAAYDFGHAGCEWVQSSCHPRRAEKPLAEVVFYGDAGTMALHRDTWTIYDPEGKEAGAGKSGVAGTGDVSHIGNFIAAIRGEAELNSPIDEGQKSTMLCHLGNIAYRTDTVVRCDERTGAVLDNPAAERLWGRPAYRSGWVVRV
jgi:predicted dehydrogenase